MLKENENLQKKNEYVNQNPYIIVKAKENGVRVMGLTRGKETRVSHTEILSNGEVLIAQITEYTAAYKIVGKAHIWTPYGEVVAEGELPKIKEAKKEVEI
ncbi:MAG: trp RNA-binding attenuation protein MtrB [candidate division WOR-3 bacterium]